mmetsp:Transcript_32287/g.89184  ORF Transcript_32287/g.89184 Transcript_32287/m.89184 type:complete len:208 (+) Transcript_32287:1356-1979(+)
MQALESSNAFLRTFDALLQVPQLRQHMTLGVFLPLLDGSHDVAEVVERFPGTLFCPRHELLRTVSGAEQHSGLHGLVHVQLCRRELRDDLVADSLRRSPLLNVFAQSLHRGQLLVSRVNFRLQLAQLGGHMHFAHVAVEAARLSQLNVDVVVRRLYEPPSLGDGLLDLEHRLRRLLEVVARVGNELRRNQSLFDSILCHVHILLGVR